MPKKENKSGELKIASPGRVHKKVSFKIPPQTGVFGRKPSLGTSKRGLSSSETLLLSRMLEDCSAELYDGLSRSDCDYSKADIVDMVEAYGKRLLESTLWIEMTQELKQKRSTSAPKLSARK